MSERYDHGDIEKKWQERWEQKRPYAATDASDKKKTYLLIEFPYPSGDGLHVGHIRSWTALDVVARKRRAQGEEVLYPIGWDAFGLPAENYAIKTHIHPTVVTKQNTDNFRRQIKAMGISFDWDREVNTTDPKYYKWTQWIFLQLYKKGLAYKSKTLINWCPKDKIGLANEEVVDGACERCGTLVEKREKEQWMLAITKYAQRLFDDLDTVNYIEAAKAGQRNWIGPSEGAEIRFQLYTDASDVVVNAASIKVFTTRPDTLFGATYLVLAPEHMEVENLKDWIKNWSEVSAYIQAAKNKSDIDRSAEGKEKTGVALKGIKAIHPITKEELPVFVADYVLGGYGTGAIMAVPAHDARDYEFAVKNNIPVRHVVLPVRIDEKNPPVEGQKNVFRKIVMALVRDPGTGKFLALKRKDNGWTTFVIGGVEEGENSLEAVRREIREESGYINPTLVHALGGPIHSEFNASHKGENRIAHNQVFLFDLVDTSSEPLAPEEAARHEVVWLDAKDISRETLAHGELDIILERMRTGTEVYTEQGILVDSGEFTGLQSNEAKKSITEAAGGRMVTTYKLRDWVFSRQRYWGEPIPMIHCGKCGWQPVPEEQLPVELPNVEKYEPTDTGESPLANIAEWVATTCPSCKGAARRETDVMPNWAGSSWYYLRYADPRNDTAFADKKKLEYWTPVDWYNGGMEHTTLHLLYSRFWHKFLFDEGLVPTSEPYAKRTSHGLILAEGGEKMSKSKGNTVSPDQLVESYGADALRLYEMFIGPFDQPVAWSMKGIVGTSRFLERAWKLKPADIPIDTKLETLLNQSVKKVGEDIEALKMNTAVSSMMILLNELEKGAPLSAYKTFVGLLAPFAPHMAHELSEQHDLGDMTWPSFDTAKLSADTATVGVQINGKLRATIELPAAVSEAEALAAARAHPAVVKWLEGKEEKRVLYVAGKIISFSTT
jgi:leucyl-tRNA synthetase